jgi:dTDP-4-amino-4,6-dideoxygalactose transaminase
MIPFNRPSFDGKELIYIAQAIINGHASGNGPFTKSAEAMLADMHNGSTTLLTSSCTHALEMAARLIDLQPGDEVIVPSWTFVSTASAFIWNGAKPVFADIRPSTLNIDPDSVEDSITDRTKAICIVHYAGVGAEPDRFVDIARRHGLTLIEDNAHGLGGAYRGQALGTFGQMSTLSFHETKNVTCGEGGALVINTPDLIERAEILREKGTNRSRFIRGQVDKYTWVDLGSSWVMSDLLAAVLVGQLERFDQIRNHRMSTWNLYWHGLAPWAEAHGIGLPTIPTEAEHTGHMFYLTMPSRQSRDRFIEHMRSRGVHVVFHYQSLHASPQGRVAASRLNYCPHSDAASDTVVRLPLYTSLTMAEQERVVDAVSTFTC